MPQNCMVFLLRCEQTPFCGVKVLAMLEVRQRNLFIHLASGKKNITCFDPNIRCKSQNKRQNQFSQNELQI